MEKAIGFSELDLYDMPNCIILVDLPGTSAFIFFDKDNLHHSPNWKKGVLKGHISQSLLY